MTYRYDEDADDIIEYDTDDDYECVADNDEDDDKFGIFMRGGLFAKSVKIEKDRVIFNYGDE